MTNTNTHKMQCKDTKKKIGNSLHRMIIIHYFYTNDASMTGKYRIE